MGSAIIQANTSIQVPCPNSIIYKYPVPILLYTSTLSQYLFLLNAPGLLAQSDTDRCTPGFCPDLPPALNASCPAHTCMQHASGYMIRPELGHMRAQGHPHAHWVMLIAQALTVFQMHWSSVSFYHSLSLL